MSAAILVIDDDVHICELLCDVFSDYGYAVSAAHSGEAALAALRERPDTALIFLDLILPDGNGLELLPRLKAASAAPVIMLSGLGGESDIVVGLEMGADDYIAKPFYPREMVARAKAVMRRARPLPVAVPRRGFVFEQWWLDTESHKLFSPEQAEVALTAGEYALLHALLAHAGRVLSRQRLLELTHDENLDIFDRTIDVLIMRLRKKLEPNTRAPRYIETVRGSGYRFAARVERLGE